MPCYTFNNIAKEYSQQKTTGFMCGNLGAHCVDCLAISDNLCDFPVGNDLTCDRPICDNCSFEIGENLHYCKTHFKIWQAFKASKELKNKLNKI